MGILSHKQGDTQADLERCSALTGEARAVAEKLANFELGRFLLANSGLNGRWTSYIVRHPDEGRHTRVSSDGTPMSELELFLLRFVLEGRHVISDKHYCT